MTKKAILDLRDSKTQTEFGRALLNLLLGDAKPRRPGGDYLREDLDRKFIEAHFNPPRR
jgi:hypothetical protein